MNDPGRWRLIVSEVSGALKRANITSVLWGDYLLRAFGALSPARQVQLIVEDEDIERAYQALLAEGYHACQSADECPQFRMECRCCHPAAFEHVYAGTNHGVFAGISINLYKKSHYIPFFPNLNESLIDSHNEFYMPASDERVPRPLDDNDQPLDFRLHDVVLLTAQKFVEALIYLAYRDVSNSGEISIWTKWIVVMRTDTCGVIDPAGFPTALKNIWPDAENYRQLPQVMNEALRRGARDLEQMGQLPERPELVQPRLLRR